jgi:hypothetical protein
MWDKIKGMGGAAIGIGIFVGFLLIIGLILEGGLWLSEQIYPWLALISVITLGVVLVVLIPLSLFKRTRMLSGNGFTIASHIFGLTLWTWAFLLTYAIWGGVALMIGLFFLGVGVVPIAMLATLFNGLWSPLVQMILLTVLVFGTRLLGRWLLTKATFEGIEELGTVP